MWIDVQGLAGCSVRYNPKGIESFSPGLRVERATLGTEQKMSSTLKGVEFFVFGWNLVAPTPTGLGIFSTSHPG